VLLAIADRHERERIEQALAPLRPTVSVTRAASRPALIVLDRHALPEMRRNYSSVPLLVVLRSRYDVGRVLDSGADAVLCGSGRAAELRARVRALLRREHGTVASGTAIRAVGPLEIDFRAHQVSLQGSPLALTPREYTLLACLALDPGRVFTKGELVRHCWGARPPHSRTLETHIIRLRRRLGVHAPMLVTVWSVGYRLLELG
jgi:DNA-binding response OmpR family regulator